MEVELKVQGITLTAMLDDVTQELLDVVIGDQFVGEHLTDWFTEQIEAQLETGGYYLINPDGEECIR